MELHCFVDSARASDCMMPDGGLRWKGLLWLLYVTFPPATVGGRKDCEDGGESERVGDEKTRDGKRGRR
jgi:hypothetical protein